MKLFIMSLYFGALNPADKKQLQTSQARVSPLQPPNSDFSTGEPERVAGFFFQI